MAFDPSRPYRLHEQVALRPEPFGALAYHYGNRRLTFLKSRQMVRLVRTLDDHESVTGALDGLDLTPGARQAYERALASLADSEVIRAR